MLQEASNEQLLAEWKRGNQRAADVLYRRYLTRLTALARSRLSRNLSRRIEADDIVMSVWRSFFVAVEARGLHVPSDDDLWPLLATITLRKIARQAARQHAQQRDVRVEELMGEPVVLSQIVARDPSPEEAAMMVDEVASLMARLQSDEREVVSRRLQGEEQAAIANALGISERTVRRVLARVREILTDPDRSSTSTDADQPVEAPLTGNSQPASIVEPYWPAVDLSFSEANILLQQFAGEGGFGRVYRARIQSNGNCVAVKYLKKRFWHNSRAVQCLLHEYVHVSQLQHPGIIRHLGCGQSRNGALFVVMEWVDGGNVAQWYHASTPGLRDVINCAIGVADALLALHSNGMIHGDVTPTNVLRRINGSFVLSDFGLARGTQDTLQRHGGTPGYLAPEQVSEVFGSVDERTDVYGLGGLVYFLATGSPPVTGGSLADVLAEVISSRSPRAPSSINPFVPKTLNDLILACLSKEITDRPPAMVHLLNQLREIADSLPG